jgi:hypothetical protein
VSVQGKKRTKIFAIGLVAVLHTSQSTILTAEQVRHNRSVTST